MHPAINQSINHQAFCPDRVVPQSDPKRRGSISKSKKSVKNRNFNPKKPVFLYFWGLLIYQNPGILCTPSLPFEVIPGAVSLKFQRENFDTFELGNPLRILFVFQLFIFFASVDRVQSVLSIGAFRQRPMYRSPRLRFSIHHVGAPAPAYRIQMKILQFFRSNFFSKQFANKNEKMILLHFWIWCSIADCMKVRVEVELKV